MMNFEIDIEAQIENHFIRKRDSTKNRENIAHPTSKRKKVNEFVPLLLKDLQHVTYSSEDDGIFQICVGGTNAQKLLFSSCIAYVHVMGKTNDHHSFYKYIIDDNTATMELSIYKHTKDLNALARLQDENCALARHSTAQNKDVIAACLQRLLCKTIEQLDASNLPSGGQLLIYGRPYLHYGQVKFAAFSFCRDNGISRDMEIAFKDYLIDYYMQRLQS